MAQQQTAAQKVYSTVELLENILDHVTIVTKAHKGESAPQLRLLLLQRVNKAFRSSINSNPQLRSTLFLDATPSIDPRTAGTTFAANTSITGYVNPVIVFDTASSRSTEWNFIHGAPKFSIVTGSKPSLKVIFACKGEAYGLLKTDVLSLSWKKLHLTSPALTTRIHVIYPRIHIEKEDENRFLGYKGYAVATHLEEGEVFFDTEPSTLGDMLKLAAKVVAMDANAWDGPLALLPLSNDAYTDEKEREKMVRHIMKMEFGTENDVKDYLATEDPVAYEEVSRGMFSGPWYIGGTEIVNFVPTAANKDRVAEEHRRWYTLHGRMDKALGFQGGVSCSFGR